MIKYKEQDYKEYIGEIRKTYMPTELHKGMMAILKVYFEFLFEKYFNTHQGMVNFLEVGGRLGEGGHVIKEIGLQKNIFYQNLEIEPQLVDNSEYSVFGDICNSRLRKNNWNIVFSRKILGYVENVEKAIKKMVYVTKPGGWIIIIQPIPYAIDPHYNSMGSESDLLSIVNQTAIKDIEILHSVGDFHEPVFIIKK